MTTTRTLIQDFSIANRLYVNAIVTFYTVLNGEKTATKANIYAALSGSTKLANPQTLDSFGKFKQPVYIEDAVIMAITGLSNVEDHDTGVVGVGRVISGTGSPETVVTASVGTLYLRTDGGAGTTLYIKESGTSNTGWIAK